MTGIDTLLTDHLDLWVSAIARKSNAGRGRSKKFSLHGIDKLRALILDLAVRGKLVPQDPADETASEWLGSLGFVTKPSGVNSPLGWAMAPLTAFGEFFGGVTPPKGKKSYWGRGIPWVSPKDMGAETIQGTEDEVTEQALKETGLKEIPPGSLLMVARSGILRRKFPVAINEMRCTTNQDMKSLVLKSGAEPRYLQIMLIGHQPRILQKLVKRGMTVESLIFDKFTRALWPIPPLAEQHRIIEKVEELMALCDRLEAGTYEAIEAHQLLVTELLATLTASRDAKELAENWARIEAHFDTLFVTEDSVDELKQTILQLAVMGRLVPQDPKDEPASELVRRIKLAKTVSHERENLRVRSPLVKGKDRGLGFVPPTGWAIASFDDLFVMVSGVTKGQKVAPGDAVELPYLRVANVQRGFLDLTEIKSISVKSSDASRYRLHRNDILMTEGGDWDKVGRAAIWSDEIEGCIHQNHVFRIRSPSDEIRPEWVIAFVNSAFGREYFQDASKQTTNLASINMTQLRLCPLPVPPLAEQHRVLEKLRGLLELCERMKYRFAAANDFRGEIADAVVAKAVR